MRLSEVLTNTSRSSQTSSCEIEKCYSEDENVTRESVTASRCTQLDGKMTSGCSTKTPSYHLLPSNESARQDLADWDLEHFISFSRSLPALLASFRFTAGRPGALLSDSTIWRVDYGHSSTVSAERVCRRGPSIFLCPGSSLRLLLAPSAGPGRISRECCSAFSIAPRLASLRSGRRSVSR